MDRGADWEFQPNKGNGGGGGRFGLPRISARPQEAMVAETVPATERGGTRWMLVELREPVLAFGLDLVWFAGHDGDHAKNRRHDDIFLRERLGHSGFSEVQRGVWGICLTHFRISLISTLSMSCYRGYVNKASDITYRHHVPHLLLDAGRADAAWSTGGGYQLHPPNFSNLARKGLQCQSV